MKRAAGKTAKPRAPAKRRAAPAGVKSAASLTDQMQEQQNLLELQNEQLCEARAELEQSQQRYADLYDEAPVGYMTLDGKGCIREINQTASQMLGWSTAHLMGKPLLPHIAAPDRKVWLKHLWESRRSTSQVITTLRLLPRDGVVRKVQFATSRKDTIAPQSAWCQTAMIDITEKSDAQTALSASEAKFRLLAENMGEVFWFTELDPPRVTYVSPAVERVWGIPTSEIYADYFSWMSAIHPDDKDAVHSAFDGWIKSGSTTFEVQYRIIHRDGSTHWIADRGIVVSRRNGQPFEISGIARDVTERKLFEMALAEKASETHAILEGTHDGILIADAETRRFTFGNRAMCRMLDVTPEELLHMGLESIHPHEALPYLREKFDAMARGELSVAENVPLLRKDGTIIPVDITASPVVIKGQPCNIGVFHDISERRRADEQFRGLLESAPDAMMIHSSDGRIQIVNAQVEKLFGYTRAELIGQTMEMLMPERFRHRHVQHRRGYTPSAKPRPMGTSGMTLLALHKDGHEIPVEISLSNLDSSVSSLVISSIRDITERRQAEDELRQSQRFALSTLEAIPASLAVLDETGTIISTNQSWKEFALANGALPSSVTAGTNYLQACESSTGEGSEEAHRFAEGIRTVMRGESRRFSMEYPCHAPNEQRWFVGYVTAFGGDGAPRVVIAHVDISKRKHAEIMIQQLNEKLESRVAHRTSQLQIANQHLRDEINNRLRLEEEILEISEREQRRIGQDLHDDLGQHLAGISMRVGVLKIALVHQESPEVSKVNEILDLLKNSLIMTRSLARGLIPIDLTTGGLAYGLSELSTQVSGVFGITCKYLGPEKVSVDHSSSLHLYRIAQEAITNAVKHGRATRVNVSLAVNSSSLVLKIRDNGVGLDEDFAEKDGMGLRIMRYRASMVGGKFEVVNNPNGEGTTVICKITKPYKIKRTQT